MQDLAETYRRTPQVFRVRTRHLSDLTGETHLISSNFPTRKRIRMLCLFAISESPGRFNRRFQFGLLDATITQELNEFIAAVL